MKSLGTKKFFWRKKIIIILLLFSLFFSPLTASKAYAWDAVIGETYGFILRIMKEQIEGMIRGLLKTMAANLINQMMEKLVSGGSGGPKFITNWEDHIIRDTGQRSSVYVNDYLTQATSGRGSSSGYQPASGFERTQQMLEKAKNGVFGPPPPVTLNEDPAKLLAKKTFKKFSQLASGNNNQAALEVSATELALQKAEDERDIAMTKAIASQGFKDTEKNGQTVTPGVVTKEALVNAQDIPNKAITAASSPGEIIAAIVSKLLSKVITSGIGNIQTQIQKQVTNVTQNAQTSLNAKVQVGGPGSM
ncbi:MAG: hypothetical protein AAB487_00210, partial [Patescibacteria group bacterium]